MRGKVIAAMHRRSGIRITPAYAGKRIRNCSPAGVARDHPRVCGEKSPAGGGLNLILGSPPRMRGKGVICTHLGAVLRITPAYAGKSSYTSERAPASRDHPRVCGEKPVAMHTRITSAGSPPRMRGKVYMRCCACLPPRITPAYAGKSCCKCSSPDCSRDHPRVCGEKRTTETPWSNSGGSPPRMRGKDVERCPRTPETRITPAYAGKRFVKDLGAGGLWDHPRVCGEKDTEFAYCVNDVGSPPRMRGKALGFVVCAAGAGITPAYAGKRLKRSHSIGHFSCILCLFHSVLHRASVSDGSRAGPCAPPCLPAQNAVPV